MGFFFDDSCGHINYSMLKDVPRCSVEFAVLLCYYLTLGAKLRLFSNFHMGASILKNFGLRFKKRSRFLIMKQPVTNFKIASCFRIFPLFLRK